MTVAGIAHQIWSTVTDTVGYLLAYRGALVLAILAAAAARWIARVLRASRMAGTLADTAFAGLTRPSGKADFASIVRAMQVRSGTALPFLIATHVATPYHLILLGPLLGKDTLLSVVFGGMTAALLSTLFGRARGFSDLRGTASPQEAAEPITALRALVREIARNGPSIAYGLLAGGAIAAWGLSPRAGAPATLCEGRMAA